MGTHSTVGGLNLAARGLGLRLVAGAYPVGVHLGTLLALPLGGVVPVLRAWLADELSGWNDVVRVLGGVWPRLVGLGPNADHGPVLGPQDAPPLFEEIDAIARRAGAKTPGQVRLSYLPCCGVTAWGPGRQGRALLVGLPLLSVLDRLELRAVLAHELAHFAKGDATTSARSIRYIEALRFAIDEAPSSRKPLRLWAWFCSKLGEHLLRPLARGQEARADRFAANLVGGDVTASALVKVALVQPLFREVLQQYDPTDSGLENLYAHFRTFWRELPEPLLTAMRYQLLTAPARSDTVHPSLIERIRFVQSFSSPSGALVDSQPAEQVLGDPDAMEQMLHNRLFNLVPATQPSVFHRAGS